MWPFSKSKVEVEDPVSEQEFAIVQRIAASMEQSPDKWVVSSTSYGHYGIFKLKEHYSEDGCKLTNTIELKVRPSNCEGTQLFYNSAEIKLSKPSRDTLEKKGEALLQEKVIRSMTRVEEDLSDGS